MPERGKSRYLVVVCGAIALVAAGILWWDWIVDRGGSGGNVSSPVLFTGVGVLFVAIGVGGLRKRKKADSADPEGRDQRPN
jgi:hypothetical protein